MPLPKIIRHQPRPAGILNIFLPGQNLRHVAWHRMTRGPSPLDQMAVGSGERVLGQVASWLLPQAGAVDALADRAAAQELVASATSERLLGPLLLVVDGGDLDLPPDLVEAAVRGHEESMLWCLHLEQRLLEVMDWFDVAGGIEYLVVKGPAVAHLDEEDPSLRSFADLDLLVAADDMDRALAALIHHGSVRRIPERRPGFDRRFVKSIGLTSPDGVELDVHRSLCSGAHGFRIPLAELFANAEGFALGGRSVAVPCRSHRALHAAYHAVVGTPYPSLRTLRDLAGYLVHPDLPLEELVGLADRWRATTVLAEAVRATFDRLSFEAPAWRSWLDSLPADPKELAIIEAIRVETAIPFEWSTVRELSWADRASFLLAVAVPSAEELASRGMTHRTRISGGLRNLGAAARSRIGGR